MRNERSKLNYTLVGLLLAGAGAAPASTYSVVYSFTGGAGGANPNTPLIRDSAGNIYGTTVNGGNTACEGGCGIIFKVAPRGKLTVLYNFTGGADGANPYTGLFQDSAGNFYGATAFGGAKGYGVVFELDTTGTETPLYTFQGGADGASPYSALVQDSGGNLYGTAAFGGAVASGFPSGCGVVFKIDTGGAFSVVRLTSQSFANRKTAKWTEHLRLGGSHGPLTGPIFCRYPIFGTQVDQTPYRRNDWPVKGQPILAASRFRPGELPSPLELAFAEALASRRRYTSCRPRRLTSSRHPLID